MAVWYQVGWLKMCASRFPSSRYGNLRNYPIQILYGLPISLNKLDDLSALWDEITPLGAVIRILVDHPGQLQLLNDYEKGRSNPRRWSAFVKIDAGSRCVNLLVTFSTLLLTREVEREYHRNIRYSETYSR